MNSLCSAHSHGFHKTNAVVATPYTTTISGAVALIAYNFVASSYSSGTFENSMNSSVDKLYLYNYGGTTPYTTIGGYNCITFFNTGNSTGNFLDTTTQYKASIGSNLPTAGSYTTRVSSISTSTTFPGMTLCFWVYDTSTSGGIICVSEWGLSNNANNRIYPSTWGGNFCMQYFGQYQNKTRTANTWYFVVYTIPFSGGTGGISATAISASSMNALSTITFNYTTDLIGSPSSNPQFYATLGAGYNDGGWKTGYIADYRVYGSALSYADLNGIFLAKPA